MDVTTTAILTFTNAAGTTNGNYFRLFHRSDTNGYLYTFTNRSPVGFHYISSTNAAGYSAATSATNTYRKLTNDWRGKLRLFYESATALRIQSFVNESLTLTISTNWATLSITTNEAGYAGTTQPGSNVAAYAFTLWNSTPPRTIQDWNQTGIHGAATNAIGEVYTNNALLLSGAKSIRFVNAPNTVVTSSFSGTEAIIGFIATGGGAAQTNIALSAVTNAGTLAYSNATTFIQFIRTSSNTWNGTFIGDGAGLTNILRSGVTGLEAALSYLTSSISGGGNFIEDNSGHGTNTTDWGSLTVKQALTVAGDSGFTSAGRAYANVGSGGVDNFIAGSADNTLGTGTDKNAILAGSQNSISTNSDNNAIAGGQLNAVGTGVNDRGQYSGVFAGYNNSVTEPGGTAQYSVIAGGKDGWVAGDYSGIFAGLNNQVLSDYNVILGGQLGAIEDGNWDALVGGYFNRMTNSGGYGNVIAGGLGNWMFAGLTSLIGGGTGNTMNNARQSFIGGGVSNLMYHVEYCAILAGRSSQVTNPGAGLLNYSLAAGRRAIVSHSGTFLWADSQDADFTSTAANQFGVRAAGGVKLETSGAGLTVDGAPVAFGDFVPRGGTNMTGGLTNNVMFSGNGAGLTNLAGGGGYTLSFANGPTGYDPLDSTTYYLGISGFAEPALDYNTAKIEVPKAGTIKRVFLKIVIPTTLASGETVSHYIRRNDTTDVAQIDTTYDANLRNLNETTVSQAVSAGDYLAFKIVTPAWSTNPLNVRWYVLVYIE